MFADAAVFAVEISGAELLPAPSAAKQESDKVSNKPATEDLAARGPDITLRSWWQLKRELKVSVHASVTQSDRKTPESGSNVEFRRCKCVDVC